MTTSPELQAGLEALTSGEWVPGPVVLREMMAAIQPGPALRAGQNATSNPDDLTHEELIRRGRRSKAVIALGGAISRGRLVVDTEDGKLTRQHWDGALAWKVRDLNVTSLSVREAADEIDVPEHVLRNWIRRDLVPAPDSDAQGRHRIPREMMPTYQKVREVWPGLNKTAWPVDPRSLWQNPGSQGLSCPHCGHGLSISLSAVTTG